MQSKSDPKSNSVRAKASASRPGPGFGGLSRSEVMSRIRGTGNLTTEERLASILRQKAVKGWRRHLPLVGRPDFAWPRLKVAVFVDGCFWHGHKECRRNISARTNREFWDAKIGGNRRRDRRVTSQLRQRGWTVIRIWECRLRSDPKRCVDRIIRALNRRIVPA